LRKLRFCVSADKKRRHSNDLSVTVEYGTSTRTRGDGSRHLEEFPVLVHTLMPLKIPSEMLFSRPEAPDHIDPFLPPGAERRHPTSQWVTPFPAIFTIARSFSGSTCRSPFHVEDLRPGLHLISEAMFTTCSSFHAPSSLTMKPLPCRSVPSDHRATYRGCFSL